MLQHCGNRRAGSIESALFFISDAGKVCDMAISVEKQKALYAKLLIKIGVNLQVGQSLLITSEVAHREFVRHVVVAAYQAGARFVITDYIDVPTDKMRFLHGRPENLDHVPGYVIARSEEIVRDKWARLALVGEEFPNFMDDVNPALLRRASAARAQALKAYVAAQMADAFPWCVAAVPTVPWAQKIYPNATPKQAYAKLWKTILSMVRADLPDPIEAWRQHDQKLKRISAFMDQEQIRAVRFVDSVVGPDGQPNTDLTVGLTDAPLWMAASGKTQDGQAFIANMPSEEIFTAPHRNKVNGWVRTSKPIFPLLREVRDAYFRFENGVVVDYSAGVGQEALDEFFKIAGTRQLGEVALVDTRSPINQSGLVFYDVLFDENAACHIAFGKAYPTCMMDGEKLSEEAQVAAGLNHSDAHDDFMIGTATMDVTGIALDGRELSIMRQGQFVVGS